MRHTVQESSIIPANCFQRATFADGKRANDMRNVRSAPRKWEAAAFRPPPFRKHAS